MNDAQRYEIGAQLGDIADSMESTKDMRKILRPFETEEAITKRINQAIERYSRELHEVADKMGADDRTNARAIRAVANGLGDLYLHPSDQISGAIRLINVIADDYLK